MRLFKIVLLCLTFMSNIVLAEEIKRGEFVDWAVRAAGISLEYQVKSGFLDVPYSHQYYPAIQAAKDLGIVNGYADRPGYFGPDDSLTRRESSKILINAFSVGGMTNCSTKPYPDVSTSDWGCKYIQKAKQLSALGGLFEKHKDVYFYPDRNLSRLSAERMVAVMNAYKQGIIHPFGYIWDVERDDLTGSYQEMVSIGQMYEPIDNPSPSTINFVVTGDKTIKSGDKVNFRVYDSCGGCSYYLEATGGSFTPVAANLSEVQFQAPNVGITARQHYLYVFVSDGLGTTTPKKISLTIEPDTNATGAEFMASYSASEDRFYLNYQVASNVTFLQFDYSYDKSGWSTLYSTNINGQYTGANNFAISQSRDNDKIYFRAGVKTSTNATLNYDLPQPLSYTPISTAGDKSSEWPVAPYLSSMSGTHVSDSITVSWRKVLDSYNKDNANHYELMVADNYRFDNETIYQAPNTATGSNLYEYIKYTVGGLQDTTTYYFKVRAVNNLGAGEWSQIQSAQIDYQNLPVFNSYIKPEASATDVAKLPEFCWSADDADGDTLEYRVLWGESASDLNHSTSFFSGSECYDLASNGEQILPPGKTIYWRVEMREDGYYKDYYGGSYISSNIHSFTTVNSGVDLAITSATLKTEIKFDDYSTFDLVVTNNGNETVNGEWINAFYVKDGVESEFLSGSVRTPDNLAPGQTVVLPVTIKFRDNLWTSTTGKVYDNVLVAGDSIVRFKNKYVSEQDLNPANNSLDVGIHYEDSNGPNIEYFALDGDGLIQDTGEIYSRQGGEMRVIANVRDDIRVATAKLEYKLFNTDTQWTLIESFAAGTESLNFRYNSQGQEVSQVSNAYDWPIPSDMALTNEARIRLSTTDDQGNASEKISEPFTIASNHLNVTVGQLSKASYKVGESITFSVNVDGHYPVSYYGVELDDGRRTWDLIDVTAGSMPSSFTVQLPNDNAAVSNDATLKVFVNTAYGNSTYVNSNVFAVTANTDLPQPFGNAMQLFTPPTQPDGSLYHSSYVNVAFTEIDESGVAHIVAEQTHHYYDSAKRYVDNGKFFYVTYDPQTGNQSAAVNIPQTYRVVDFKLAPGGTPYLLFDDSSQLSYATVQNGTLSSIQKLNNENIEQANIFEVGSRAFSYPYIIGNKIFELRNIRYDVDYYDFNNGYVGTKYVMPLNGSNSRYLDASEPKLITHSGNVIYFVDPEESQLVKIDTLAKSLTTFDLPITYSYNTDRPEYVPKVDLSVFNGELYLAMRGKLFKLSGSSLVELTDIAFATSDKSVNYNVSWDEVDEIFLVPNGTKLSILMETEWSVSLPYNHNWTMLDYSPASNTFSQAITEPKRVEFRYPRGLAAARAYGRIRESVELGNGKLLTIQESEFKTSGIEHKDFSLGLFDLTTGDFNIIGALAGGTDGPFAYSDYPLLQGSNGVPYIIHGANIFRVNLGTSIDIRKFYENPKFSMFNNELFVHYDFNVPYDGRDTNITGAGSDRSNIDLIPLELKRAVKVYPAKGSEFTLSDSVRNRSLDDLVVFDNHIYTELDRFYPLNSDFTINDTPTCQLPQDSGYINLKVDSQNYLGVVANKINGRSYFTLLNKDCSVNREIDVSIGDSAVSNYAELNGMLTDDMFLMFGYYSPNTYAYKYDIASGQMSTVVLPKRTEDPRKAVAINSQQKVAATWSEGGIPFIAFADFSNDIVAPSITLSASVSKANLGEQIALTWQASDNQNQLQKFDLYVSQNEGTQMLLQSYTDTTASSYTYTVPNDVGLNSLTFKVVATDSSNNWGVAQTAVIVEQPVTITSFVSDKVSYQRGEKVSLNWSIDGANVEDNIQLFGRSGTEDWALLAENLVTGTYQMDTDTLTGSYDFKLAVREQSEVLSPQIEITGTWLNFDYEQFTPVTTAYVNTSAPVFSLSWGADVTDTEQWVAEVFVKTNSETEFSSIATGKYRSFEWEPVATPDSFTWYVTVNLDGVEFKSAEQNVSVAQLSPVENLSLSLLNNTSATPQVLVSYSAPANGAQVLIQRSLNFADFVTLATIDSNAYIDSNVGYGDIVSYRAIAIIGENHAAYTQSQDLAVNAKLPTGIEFTSADFASGAVVSYKPVDTDTVFESYQVRLGLAEQDEALWSTVADNTGKQVTIPTLESGKIYTLRVYAKTPLGDRLNSVTAEKTFATAYSYTNLTTPPVVSIDNAVSDSIKLSWTIVDGGESYRVYRNASSSWELVEDTTGLSFSDFNVTTGSSYQYKVQVLNPISSVESAPTDWVLVDGDFDGDGIGDATDPDDDNDGVADASDAFPLDATEYVDTDGDGIGNNADTDDDGDGYVDASDAFPLDATEYVDTDGDGIGNNADTDDDGDGVADASDAFPLDATEVADTDGDGVGDNADAFPTDATEIADTDGDGVGDNADVYPNDTTRNGVEWIATQWGSEHDDTLKGIVKDNLGNLYLVGRRNIVGQSDSVDPMLIVKYDAELNKLWEKPIGLNNSGSGNTVVDVAIDSADNLYVIGTMMDSFDGMVHVGGVDGFIAKYDSDANLQWNDLIGTVNDDVATHLRVKDGAVFVSGYTYGQLDGNANAGDGDLFVIKFNLSGQKQWTTVVGGMDKEIPRGLGVNSKGDIFLAGVINGRIANQNSIEQDGFVAKLDSNGYQQWIKLYGTPLLDDVGGLVIDSLDNIYIAGRYATASSAYDLYLSKLDSSGVQIWRETVGSSGYENISSLLIDSQDHLYFTGQTEGEYADQRSYGENDVLLAKYTIDGTLQWISTFGGTDQDFGLGLVKGIDGNIVVSVRSYAGMGGKVHQGGMDAYLLKYNENEFPTDADIDGISDAVDTDDDNDGIPDSTEIAAGLDPLDASDATQDLDGDGISNLDESNAGTNINNPDTDGDNYNDSIDEAPLDVNAWDLTAPVLTLNGQSAITITVGDSYINEGATAIDNFDGDITSSIVVSGVVDSNTAGEYTLSYNVSDAVGNAATAVIRTVTVESVVTPPDTVNVYTNNFNSAPGAEWSDNSIATSNGESFLGTNGTGFGNGTVSLQLGELPAHNQVTVAFDLYIINSWDGNGGSVYEYGHDHWQLTADGQNLILTSFANNPTVPQSYPNQLSPYGSGGDNPYQTGASSLGHTKIGPNDSAYRLEFTFEHTGSSLELDFTSFQDQLPSDEAWGIDNIVVDVTPVVQSPDLPVVTPPADIVVAAIDANGTPANASAIRNFLNGAEARDASGGILFTVDNDAPSIFSLGSNTVTFSATDSAGLTGTAQAKVTVVDMTAPVLSLVGSPSVTITEGDNYLDSGANASDNVDGNITANIAVSGSVNVNAVGTYALTYNVSDSAGNAANSVSRTVTVESAQIGSAPVVSAPADITVAATDSSGTSATSWSIKRFLNNAAASDAEDGIMWTVNHNAPSIFPLGVTTVTFSATDSHGNVGTDTATVTVADQTKPVITLQGSSTVTLNHGDNYVDAGATASDNIDGDISSNISKTGSVNTSTSGTYTLAYNVSDNAGNAASTVYRYVTVLAAGDTTPPVVTPPVNITVAATDANGTAATVQAIKSFLSGAYASDDVDGILFTVDHDAPAVFGLGVNTVTFSATDAAGNTGTAQATVTVNDVTPPVITLIGSNAITVEFGNSFTDKGATAIDNVDANVTASIVVTGSVDTWIKGNYRLNYNVADAAGNNAAQVTRAITVQDASAPVVRPHNNITVAANDANGTPATDPHISAFLTSTTAYDLADGIIIDITNDAPATFPLGVTTVTSQATDSIGNVGVVQATVTVADMTAPALSTNSTSSLTLTVGSSFEDPGATAVDNVDGEMSLDVQVSGTVDTSTEGNYVLTYSVSDAAGNAAAPVFQGISVQSVQAPVVVAPDEIVVEAASGDGLASSESAIVNWLANAAANDAIDGPLNVVNDIPAILPLGSTKVSFSATDNQGNTGTGQGFVRVVDTAAPVVSLKGENTVTLNIGELYSEAGINAIDAVDGDISNQVTVNGGFNPNQQGMYHLSYSIDDAAGNVANPLLRTIVVKAATAPTVTPPANIEVAATSTGGISTTDSTIANFLSGASAVDSNNQPLSVTHNAPSLLPKGVTLVTFSTIDSTGRKGYAQAVVTVK